MNPAMERALRACRSPRGRLVVNVGCALLAVGVAVLAARHFASVGWPLANADLKLVALAGALFVVAYGFKAFGWERLFAPAERPGPVALAAAGGAACVSGAALPGRFDDVVRIAVVRRWAGPQSGVGTVCFSLFMLGLVASGRLLRFRLARWLGERTTCPRDAWKAWVLVLASWLTRALALFVLLAALHVTLSFGLALAFLCAAAATGALPVAPAGAATQAGAGAAILIASGIGTSQAVAFAVAAQALLIVAGAAVIVMAAAWQGGRRLMPARAVSQA